MSGFPESIFPLLPAFAFHAGVHPTYCFIGHFAHVAGVSFGLALGLVPVQFFTAGPGFFPVPARPEAAAGQADTGNQQQAGKGF